MIYVEVKLHTGELIGTMEIKREEALDPENRLGEYSYQFKYGGPRCKGDRYGSGARHNRNRDVWHLIKTVLTQGE